MSNRLDGKTIAAELARGNFADARLTRRLERIVEGIARSPQASLPSVFTSAELEGAYRFFSNPLVTPEAILAPHFEATKARVARERCVRVVHDQTEFSYRRQGKREGLGDRAYQGFSGHFSLAVSGEASRRPLGLGGLHAWARGNGEKEQALWLQQIEKTSCLFERATNVVHICDRGSEDFVLFNALITRGHRFVIRTGGRRWTESGPDGSRMMLRDVLATIEHVTERAAKINGRKRHSSATLRKIHPPRKPRIATLHIAATAVELARPVNYGKRGTVAEHLGDLPMTLSMNVVRVWEPAAPEGEEPIEWLLFTNEPIATVADVITVVDHYRARWTIEEYFKALKTGCAFERRQLRDYEALTNALAVFAPLAYQVLLLRTVARDEPNAPAALVVGDDQIDVLRALGRVPLPPEPTARDALLAVAALGGHIKYAPDPGWLTIARGYEKLELLTTGWLAARLQPPSDQR
jgi:hypothetical protein